MTFKNVALGLVAALGITSAAQAATVTFDFTAANAGWANSLSYTSGGLSMTVTGGDTTGGKGHVATWAGWGLGMASATDCPKGKCSGTDHQIDSSGLNDVVTFAFSKAVSVTQLAFNLVDKDDTFTFAVNGGAASQSAVSPVVALASALGTSFSVGAGETTSKKCFLWFCNTSTITSAFKLKSLTVTVADEPAPVPVPAAGLLLAGGLAGLAAVRRRKRA